MGLHSPFLRFILLILPSPPTLLYKVFAQHLQRAFRHRFTPHQAEAALRIGAFLADPRDRQAFILRGYAGTGKTSLTAAVAKVWEETQNPVVLLAPTGRAAKVLATHAGKPAYTIHKMIYRQQTFRGEDTRFDLGWNKKSHVLFIVDEASMLSCASTFSVFGTGNVLEDLVSFVFSQPGCRLMFVGDIAQLPPVGEQCSPALVPATLRGYGLNVRGAELKEVVRQQQLSPVLREATKLRQQLEEASADGLPDIDCSPSPNADSRLSMLPGDEVAESIEDSYRQWGIDDTIIVTLSNRRAAAYNEAIRRRILMHDDLLNSGDRVMAVKNNYHWTEEVMAKLSPEDMRRFPLAFIANGDCAIVVRYKNVHEMYGFCFCDVTLRFPDYENICIDVRANLSTLNSPAPALTESEQRSLFEQVEASYSHIRDRRERMKAVRRDAYYNALQIKYAYAVTCHKAQGGQWHDVYVDPGYMPLENMDATEFLRWLYTALTRTSANLFLLNWPQNDL